MATFNATAPTATADYITAETARKRNLAKKIAARKRAIDAAKRAEANKLDTAIYVEKRADGQWCEYTFISLAEKCRRIRVSFVGKVKCSECDFYYETEELALKTGVELDPTEERNAGVIGFQDLDGSNMTPTNLWIKIRCNECSHTGSYECKPNPLWTEKT